MDAELAALKGKLSGAAPSAALPAAATSAAAMEPVTVEVQQPEVDAELEQLKRSIDKL